MQSIISALTSDPKTKQLDAFKVDDAAKGNTITTNFGVKVVNQEETLKAGNRGPDLLEDFIYREKISHFDHERIPERVVHARGVAAHGYFQVYESQKDLTKAGFLNDPSLKTPVFLRFSTVLGSKGSADTVRDVRGFAVRFYTQEGNWDMVGNNIPVFFVQDAMKFPDVIHAGKPEPHNEIPQGATAHDNFWDWISLQSESAHMMMWIMSDRAIPRSLRMIQGFGVHSFVLINEQGQRRFVKFHWRPVLGVHSLVWDESQKIAGQDPDFHRRDLTEAIESGNYPEWELGLQIVEEKDEHSFDFDILDATKLIPEELVPIKYVGKMTLNRNVDDYFAETEQVAFCTQHFVPGIQGSNDPLLQGRHFSYQDTQLTRLGGPNFQEIPINRPVCPVFNHQRDGFNRQKIATSKVNYHPNRFGFPKQATEAEGGFLDYAAAVAGVKERALGPKFKEHYNQATLFYNSLTQVEKDHLTDSFIFELGHVNDKAIQERVVDRLNHIEPTVAKKVAYALGLAEPVPIPGWANHGKSSPALSQVSGPNVIKGSIKTRKIAVLIAEGFDAEQFTAVQGAITKAGGMVQVIAPRKAAIKSSTGTTVEANWSFAACKSTLFDAVFVVGGAESVRVLSQNGSALAFVTESFKHLKAVGAVKEGIDLLRLCHLVGASFASKNGEVLTSVGVVTGDSVVGPAGVAEAFIQAVGQHRAFERVVSGVPA